MFNNKRVKELEADLDIMSIQHKIDNSLRANQKNRERMHRDKIIELDSSGSFIPIGTKNVFLKYYSSDVKEAVQWNKDDMDSYFKVIKKVLKDYLGESNE